MTINAMPITNPKVPVVFDIPKVLNVESCILILFIWFVRNFSFLSLSSNFVNWILKSNVNDSLCSCLRSCSNWICYLNCFNRLLSFSACSSLLRHIHWSRLNVRFWSNLNLISLRPFWTCSCLWILSWFELRCLAQRFYGCWSLRLHWDVECVIGTTNFRIQFITCQRRSYVMIWLKHRRPNRVCFFFW